MIALTDSNNTHSSEELIPPSTNQQQQNASINSSSKALQPRRVTPKTIKNHQSNSTVATHRIGDWTIQESLVPFSQKENKSSSIKQDFSNKSNVYQWNIEDVCLFFEDVLSKNCYTPMIKEHLIDGIALLLLKEEHLRNIFHMPSGSRNKLLSRINQLKTDNLSILS